MSTDVHRLIPLIALALNLVLLGSALAADRKRASNRVFAFFASAFAVWNFGVLELRWTTDPSAALAWERFLHVGVIPTPVLLYHYVLLFLDLRNRRRGLALGYALSCVFWIATPSTAFMTAVRPTVWGFVPVIGPLYGAFFVYFQAYTIAAIVVLVRGYRSLQSGFRRNRTLLVIVGASVSIVGGLIDLSRFVFGWEWLYPAGIPTNAVFALTLGIALVRYRLIDLSVLAKRSVLYLLTAIALAPVIFASLYAVDHFTPRLVGPGPDIDSEIPYLVAVLAALVVAFPLLSKLEEFLDRVIFKRQHGVRDALVALSKEMSSVLEVAKLGDTLTRGLVARIPVLHASFHLYDAAHECVLSSSATSGAEDVPRRAALDRDVLSWLAVTRQTFVVEEAAFQTPVDPRMHTATARLESARIGLLLPLFVDRQLTAVLAVGEKLSGESFDHGEIELLETLMEETAIALRNARLYGDVRRQMEELGRTQEQLLQSARLAALGELAAGVAHEISNPLTAILSTTSLLIHDAAEDAEMLEKLSDIERAARRAAKISRQLLEAGRRREPQRTSLELRDIIQRSLILLQPTLNAARVEVQMVFDTESLSIVGDADELTQVFINVFANASDSMPAGGTLVIRSERVQHEGRRWISVAVTDTGVGIDYDQLSHIFEPFYTTKPEGRGTGLGLSIARGIMVKHGGRIDAESKRGKGTTMTLKFPVSS